MVSALQQRFNQQSGVNIDTELSNLIALQNAYGANARVMSTIQQMMSTLLQAVHVMSITGPGSLTAANIAAVNNMNNQLNALSQELGSGEAAQTYSGLGSQAGVALGAKCAAFGDQRLQQHRDDRRHDPGVAQSVLTQLGDSGSAVEQAVNQQGAFSLNNTGQTSTQASAATQLEQILSLLNTQVGSNYIFSGNAVNQPSVASMNEILNGNGAQAGLDADDQRARAGRSRHRQHGPPDGRRQRIRTSRLARTARRSAFRLRASIRALTGATVNGPTGSPPTASVSLGSNPNAGDTIQFNLTLPDGSSQTISLQATTIRRPAANQFTIGANASATATNIQTALTNRRYQPGANRAAGGVRHRRRQ